MPSSNEIATGSGGSTSKCCWPFARCRTAALGGHLDECTRCGHRATISYNSCRNRHCPKCQVAARERWIATRRRELLPTRYAARGLHTSPAGWPHWFCRTRSSSTISCSAPVQKPFSKWLAIRDISAQKLASSACCTTWSQKLDIEPSLRMPVIIISFVFNE